MPSIPVKYWTEEGVRWADWSSILNSGGSPVGWLEFNIEQRRWLGGLTGIFYHRVGNCMGVECWAVEGLRWAHWSCIFSYQGSWVGSLKFNIELPGVSGGLIGVEYWATEGLRWAHWSWIFSSQGSWVGSLESNIKLRRVSNGLIEVQYWPMEGVR